MKKMTLLLTGLLSAAMAGAQNYPAKPVSWVVPFPSGGTTDLIARIVADKLSKELGQTVTVDNIAGGGGSAGAGLVAKAAPDGYTIGMATVSTHAVNPACNAKLVYHPIRDFLPVTNLARTPNVLVVNKNFPAKNFKEFLAEIKGNPEEHSYASTGHCGVTHMMGELFQVSTGTALKHVSYQGAGPALKDLISGKVPIMFDNLPASIEDIKSGNIRAVAVASDKRIPSMPDVPTFRELDLRAVNDPAWYGVVVPVKTPNIVVSRLQQAFIKILAMPEVRQKLAEIGAEPVGNSPADFWVEINAELGKMRLVVKRQKISF